MNITHHTHACMYTDRCNHTPHTHRQTRTHRSMRTYTTRTEPTTNTIQLHTHNSYFPHYANTPQTMNAHATHEAYSTNTYATDMCMYASHIWHCRVCPPDTLSRSCIFRHQQSGRVDILSMAHCTINSPSLFSATSWPLRLLPSEDACICCSRGRVHLCWLRTYEHMIESH